MNRTLLSTLAILVAGDLLLLADRARESRPGSFDFEGFTQAAADALRCGPLDARWFADESLLPRDYLLLEPRAETGPLISVYIGYYRRQGLLADAPHDPEICYAASGWTADGPPRIRTIPASPSGEPLLLREIVVQRGSDRRRALYWRQQRGCLPWRSTARVPWWNDLLGRWRSGRSDLAWVRLELDAGCEARGPDWAQRIRNTMAAVAAAMR